MWESKGVVLFETEVATTYVFWARPGPALSTASSITAVTITTGMCPRLMTPPCASPGAPVPAPSVPQLERLSHALMHGQQVRTPAVGGRGRRGQHPVQAVG